MSVLRLLSPSRTASSSRLSPAVPTLNLHVPQYGAIFMTRAENVNEPDDFLFRGELDITLPLGGRKKVSSISVTLRTVVKLDIGPLRRGEEDVLFERKVDISGDQWLEEGIQRFEFTLIIPSNLAPHDWHFNGTIRHALHADVVGLELERPVVKARSSGKARSHSPRPHSPRSESPHPAAEAPPYEDTDSWLRGTFTAKRTIMLLYNPHPTGGVSALSETASGYADGIGVWDLTLFSDVVSSSPSQLMIVDHMCFATDPSRPFLVLSNNHLCDETHLFSNPYYHLTSG
jgi:hypothetical protein